MGCFSAPVTLPAAAPPGLAPPIYGGGLPGWGARGAFCSDPLGFYLRGFRQHGPLFRTRQLGHLYHVMAGPEANDFIFQSNDLWDYALARAHFRENFSDRYLPQLNGPEHRSKRRRLSPAFKPAVLMQHFPAMHDTLVRRIDGLGGAPTDLRAFTRSLITAMTSTAFLQRDLADGVDRWIALFEHDLLRGGSMGSFRHLWYARPSYRRNRGRVFAAIDAALGASGAPKDGLVPDLIALMLADASSGGSPPTREEVVHDVAMLYLAGSDSTSSVILWTLMFLDADPGWREELRAELASFDPARFTSLSDFPKLRATVTEVERLRPPFPTFGKASNRDFAFAGMRVPRGAPIIHALAVPHFMEEIFPDPLRFRPARFIERPETARNLGLFGGGAHACLGQPMARIQETLAVAGIVARYDVVFDGTPRMDARFDGVTAPAQARLTARLMRRGRS